MKRSNELAAEELEAKAELARFDWSPETDDHGRPVETSADVGARYEAAQARAGAAVEANHGYLAHFHEEHTMRVLRRYGPPAEPVRDRDLQTSDDEIIDQLRRVQFAGLKASTQDRQWAKMFGEWRYSVMRYELRVKANLELLLMVAQRFYLAGLDERYHDVLEFIRREYKMRIDSVPSGWLAIRETAERRSRRRDLISDELLYGRPLPRSHAARTDLEQMGFHTL